MGEAELQGHIDEILAKNNMCTWLPRGTLS